MKQDDTEYGSCVASSEKTLQFFVCFIIIFFYVLDVVSITVYDRHTLLNIGSSVTQTDFEFLNAGALFTDTASEPFVWPARPRKCRQKRGKRAGVFVRLRRCAFRPPLPTILLANVQSLDNKLCELRARTSYQRETRDCCVICLTETCGVMKGTYTLLNPSAPLIWNFICFCIDHSGYRGNLQRS